MKKYSRKPYFFSFCDFLVLPDASDPTVNVYAEGASNDEADLLLNEVSAKIETLVA